MTKTRADSGQSSVVKEGAGWGRSWLESSTHYYDGEPLGLFITAWGFRGLGVVVRGEHLLQGKIVCRNIFEITFVSGTNIYIAILIR